MTRRMILNQAGDTIIEVLLSVIVVGLAIGLGYGVASRSLKANQQAQERIEALKLVEGQVERLKQRAATDDGVTDTIFRGGSFCLGDAGGNPNSIINTPAPGASVATDPLGSPPYNEACVNGRYHLSITPPPGGSDTKQFTIRARWFGLGSNEKEETVITYRVYPQNSL